MSHLPIASFILASGLLAAVPAGASDTARDGYRLMEASGCAVCHEVEQRPPGSPLPAAPAFQEIAHRYRSDPGAASRLTSVVLAGSGPLRGDRHWAGRTAFDTMYPKESMLTEAEVRQIVDWILTLDAKPAPGSDAHAQRRGT